MQQQRTHKNRWTSSHCLHAAANSNPDDEITRQLERARALIAKTKAKIEAQEVADAEGTTTTGAAANVPFFASKDNKSNSKKDKVIKTQNEDGLFTTDGDLMAQMSESEEWEVRPLNEVFQTEKEITRKTNKLANRDMSAGIQGLQRVLQTEDYLKIFDKRNRFIGDN
jgi:di/tripeptidase